MKLKNNMKEQQATIWFRVFMFLALISVGAACFVVQGIYGAESRIGELEQGIAESLEGTVSGRSMERVLEQYVVEFKLLESQFVQEDKIVSFIEYIEDSADSAGAILEVRGVTSVEGITPKDDDDKKRQSIELHDHVAIVTRVEGSWRAVVKFIADIEYASRGVYIKQATLTHLDAEETEDGFVPERWAATVSFGVILDSQ